MTVVYRIDRTAHRVVLTVTRRLVNDEVDQCYAQLFVDPQFVPGLDLLIDLRGSEDLPTADVIRERAQRSKRLLGPFSGRVAQLFATNGVQFGMGRMYAVLAEAEGITAGTFTSLAEADQWLLAARARLPGT
jgi:hypothetical protein